MLVRRYPRVVESTLRRNCAVSANAIGAEPMLVYRCASICDAEPAVNKHWGLPSLILYPECSNLWRTVIWAIIEWNEH